ncbi:MAG: ATP-binding protein [Rhodospirillales bacterium]
MFGRLSSRIGFIGLATVLVFATSCAMVVVIAWRASVVDAVGTLRTIVPPLAAQAAIVHAGPGEDGFGSLAAGWAPVASTGIVAVRLVDREGRILAVAGDVAAGPVGPFPALPPTAVDPRPVAVIHGGSAFRGDQWVAARQDLAGRDLALVAVVGWVAIERHLRTDAAWMAVFAVPGSLAFVLLTLLALRRAEQAQLSAQRAEAELQRRERVEVQLRQTQKMEALGLLTGGVAHDFNNLLTAIQGNLRVLRRECSPGMADRLDSIGLAVERGERLARQLLTFARPQAVQRSLLDVNDVIRQILPLIERTVSAAIDVRIALTTRQCFVEVDRAGLELSILNLVGNARDAMADGGTLTVLTEHVPRGLDGRPLVLLSVTDSGVGIPLSLQERVFEPFFTTKEVGKGTGLGLSAVYGFVRQAGGSVQIESAPGLGTTVNLLLPESARREAPMFLAQAAPELAGAPLAQPSGLVLVVEDDALVRMVTVDGLREAGLEVIVAEDAPEALKVLEEIGTTLDAVVTDVVMPRGMSGIDLARAVRKRWPDLVLIVTTGYSATDIPVADLPVRHAVLMKPFAVEELVATLTGLLQPDAAARQLALI